MCIVGAPSVLPAASWQTNEPCAPSLTVMQGNCVGRQLLPWGQRGADLHTEGLLPPPQETDASRARQPSGEEAGIYPNAPLHSESLFWCLSVCFTPKLGFLFILFQAEPGTITAAVVPSGPRHTGATAAGRNSSCHPGLSIPPALGQGWETQNLLPAPQTERSERLLVQRVFPELFLWTWECLSHPKIKHHQLSTMVRDKIQSLGGSHHLTSAFSAFPAFVIHLCDILLLPLKLCGREFDCTAWFTNVSAGKLKLAFMKGTRVKGCGFVASPNFLSGTCFRFQGCSLWQVCAMHKY